MGTNTDPYQWCESKYRLMPGIWEALRDFRNPCSVLTKSPLLLRDLDLMKEIAAVTDIHANLSIPTLDEKPWRASEPHTPHPRKRIEAVAELNRAGIPTGVLIAPLMPGINDSPKQVEAILQACADAGATSIGGIALHLRGEVRHVFMEWLRSYRPDLVERYEELYARGAYVGARESERGSSGCCAARAPIRRRASACRRDAWRAPAPEWVRPAPQPGSAGGAVLKLPCREPPQRLDPSAGRRNARWYPMQDSSRHAAIPGARPGLARQLSARAVKRARIQLFVLIPLGIATYVALQAPAGAVRRRTRRPGSSRRSSCSPSAGRSRATSAVRSGRRCSGAWIPAPRAPSASCCGC